MDIPAEGELNISSSSLHPRPLSLPIVSAEPSLLWSSCWDGELPYCKQKKKVTTYV